MADSSRKQLDDAVSALFSAERSVRRLRAELADAGGRGGLEALEAAVSAAREEDDEDERTLRLVCVAEVLGDLSGAKAVDLLIEVLASEEPEARHAAGLALEELAFERFKEVALGIERALDRLSPGNPALAEIPYILLDVPEPGVLKLLHRFLEHTDPEAVAAAIEACAELGDPRSTKALAKLAADERMVSLDDESDVATEVTLGELAREACELLEAASKAEER